MTFNQTYYNMIRSPSLQGQHTALHELYLFGGTMAPSLSESWRLLIDLCQGPSQALLFSEKQENRHTKTRMAADPRESGQGDLTYKSRQR